jgi:hypothetical protein
MPNINAAYMAQAEATALQQAVDLLRAGGRIPDMRVASAVEVMPGSEVTANTANIILSQDILLAIAAAMEVQINALAASVVEALKAD